MDEVVDGDADDDGERERASTAARDL